jgi:hypothetical protein
MTAPAAKAKSAAMTMTMTGAAVDMKASISIRDILVLPALRLDA